jgi:acyl carrier protein
MKDLPTSLSDFPTSLYSRTRRAGCPGVERKQGNQSMASLSVQAVVDIVIDFLAEHQDRPVQEVYQELAARGHDLPIDSVLIMEILARVEKHFGVRIPADAEAGRSLRSVWAFAETVYDTMQTKEHQQ